MNTNSHHETKSSSIVSKTRSSSIDGTHLPKLPIKSNQKLQLGTELQNLIQSQILEIELEQEYLEGCAYYTDLNQSNYFNDDKNEVYQNTRSHFNASHHSSLSISGSNHSKLGVFPANHSQHNLNSLSSSTHSSKSQVSNNKRSSFSTCNSESCNSLKISKHNKDADISSSNNSLSVSTHSLRSVTSSVHSHSIRKKTSSSHYPKDGTVTASSAALLQRSSTRKTKKSQLSLNHNHPSGPLKLSHSLTHHNNNPNRSIHTATSSASSDSKTTQSLSYGSVHHHNHGIVEVPKHYHTHSSHNQSFHSQSQQSPSVSSHLNSTRISSSIPSNAITNMNSPVSFDSITSPSVKQMSPSHQSSPFSSSSPLFLHATMEEDSDDQSLGFPLFPTRTSTPALGNIFPTRTSTPAIGTIFPTRTSTPAIGTITDDFRHNGNNQLSDTMSLLTTPVATSTKDLLQSSATQPPVETRLSPIPIINETNKNRHRNLQDGEEEEEEEETSTYHDMATVEWDDDDNESLTEVSELSPHSHCKFIYFFEFIFILYIGHTVCKSD